MNFLSPWFLVGALAIAGPILFHLIRRAARERMPFSSLMFLHPTPPRTVRRRKIEHLLLLLLRCACLLLIATGFARPFLSKSLPVDTATGGQQLVLLVDTSASMRRDGIWEKARAVAERYLAKASPADQVAVMTFDRQVRTVVSLAEWSSWTTDARFASAKQRLAAISPGWMGTQLGFALTAAAEQFQHNTPDGTLPKSRVVVLISDMQEGAKLDGLQGHEWLKDARVVIERVDGNNESNAGLEILDPSGNTTGQENDIHVRVVNAGNSRKEKFRLDWGGGGASSDIYLPPGQSRTFTAPKLAAGTATGKLQLSGDDIEFDNTSYFTAPEIENIPIACLGMEPSNDPAGLLYYLQRIFQPAPRRNVQLVDSLTNAAFAIISGKLPQEQSSAVRDWLTGGKSALLVLNNAQAQAFATLLGLSDPSLTESSGDFALLGRIDFKHPIFAPFDDPRFSDFSRIHFWKHRRWEIPSALQANVLADFDDHSPALVEVPVGKGRLLILTSGWNPEDSQLAVSSKFPPLIQTMLEWSGSTAPVHYQFRTGDPIPSPATSGATVQWQKPDGKQIALAAGAPFLETDMPGIYQVTWENRHRQFAVNLPADESRIAPMPIDELARLGVPIGAVKEQAAATARVQKREMQRTELENHQKLWRWMLAAALAIALLEIILSGWLARRAATVEAIT
ncbi:MAG TPA: BatA domain-containing protein [Verrucomicrobiae bacterium]|nr:BatA domain-containing protein [Verrucomicrobiae bacterium]